MAREEGPFFDVISRGGWREGGRDIGERKKEGLQGPDLVREGEALFFLGGCVVVDWTCEMGGMVVGVCIIGSDSFFGLELSWAGYR